jgi:glutamate dehydrogenase
MDRRSASVDPDPASTLDEAVPAPDGYGGDDHDLEPPIPNLERLVSDAMAMAAAAGGDGPDLADLVNRFWRLVPDEEIAGYTPQMMLGATRDHLELAQQRLPGQVVLRVDRTDEHTVLLIVTDDMPFLVDSVTAVIAAAGQELELFAHPQVVVHRQALGALTKVRPTVEPDDRAAGDIVESWMRVEVRLLHDDAAVAALRNDVQRVLTDVRDAVEDWPRMRGQALALADELALAHLPVPDKDITDSVELLRWLTEDHFTFIGYREYRLVEGEAGEPVLQAVLGTGLGILRGDARGARALKSMSPEAYQRILEKRLLIITKANSRSTVHRSAYLDYIGFKVFDADGTVIGERRFLGLFSSTAYRTSVRHLPVIKRKVAEVMARSGLSVRGHSGKYLMSILEDYPREELFQIATDDLYRTVMGVMRLAGRRQVRLFARKDQYGRFISCLVYLPRDRFTTANRLKMQEILLQELNGIGLDYTTRVNDSMLARIHFIVRTDPASPVGEIDSNALSTKLADGTRPWEDDFALLLERKLGEEQARILLDRYAAGLPETYKDSHDIHEAAQDIAKLELLDEAGQLVLHLFRRRRDGDGVRFKVFRYGEPMMLSDVLPVLHSLGVRVEDERPFEISRSDAPREPEDPPSAPRKADTVFIYDFGLALPPGALDLAAVRAKVENAFSAVWRGEAELDRFNELVLRAGLTWRQVVVLRAYAKYLRQTGTVFSQEYMESTFVAYPEVAANLVALFERRFDPNWHISAEERETESTELVETIQKQLEAVSALDQDRILRGYLALIMATQRTSFFQRTPDEPGSASRPKSYTAFKLDPQAMADLPAPRPKHEIFVYSPRFEGVHLRFGPIARGGIRWSDRAEDFRTEVLGLVKAQTVKNAVIVPTGAKGGFVVKRRVTPDRGTSAARENPVTRDAIQAEGVACYRQFIAALLDVTDNLVGGAVVPPSAVVRHDGDDPYLVVAADKGTATFSDIANEISTSYGFWLGDAFASGGSAGYDHKKMGITARGAWESVKRHFREMNVDISSQDFTVVGIGDMSGDVFGNGMLLSDHIRLVAAFDHRHIFVDPRPDPASSIVERRRLFELRGSSWDDYDRALISPGGGVWPRSAKSITVTAEMRAALGIDDSGVGAVAPAELIRAILQAPVDLLWNGGIGTYVKATTETHADVGDKANDGVRVNGEQVRARVIGEGGNLGLTQRGRIEYAMREGEAHICTDFIDNSAGVDCSDHEVNVKILLGSAVADGSLTLADRDTLLAAMTDEVATLVLRDNYDQARALGNSRAQTLSLLPVHRRMLKDMERSGHLDRALEALPTDGEVQARAVNGRGLTSPELAVLLAYTKILLTREINDSSLPDDDWTPEVLAEYFPTPLRERYADRMASHRLRREIVTTSVVNEVVNRGGISFVFRAVEETGARTADVIRAYTVVRDVFGLNALWDAVEAEDNKVPAAAQTEVYLEVRRLVDRAVRWLVTNRRTPIDVTAETARLRPGVTELLPELDRLFRGSEREALDHNADRIAGHGVPRELAEWASRLMYGFGLLDIVEVARSTERDLREVAGVYYVVSDRFNVDDILSKISALPRDDRWQTLARMALRYDLYAALAALTTEVLAASDSSVDPEERVAQWERANESSIERTRKAIGEFEDSRADLAALSVLLRQIRTLVRASSASS